MSLFLDQPYLDHVSLKIAQIGAVNNLLGEAYCFIKNRRSVNEFAAFVRGERKLRRSMRRERWSCSAV